MKCLYFILLLIGSSLAETDQDAYPEHDAALYNFPVRGSALRGFGQSPVAPTTAAPQPSHEQSVKENEANFSDGRVYLTKKLLLLKKFFAGGTPKVITIDKPVPIPLPVPQSESSAAVSNNGGAAATGTVTATAAETGANANTGDEATGAEEDDTESNASILAGRRRTPVRYAYRNVYDEEEDDEELDDDELGREQDDDSDNELEDDDEDLDEDDEDYDDEALIIEERPVGRDSAHRILVARQNRPVRPIRRRRPDPNDDDRFDVNKRRGTLPPLPPLDYEDDFPNPPPRKNKRRRPQNQPIQNIQPQQPVQEEAEEEPEAQGGVIHGISQALGLGNLANGLVGGNQANNNNNKGDANKVGVNRVGANNGGGNRRGGNRRGGNRRGQVGFGQGQGGFVQGGGGGGGQGGFVQGGGGGGGRPQRPRKPQRRRQQGNRRRFVGTNNGNLKFKGNNKNRRRKFQTAIGANGQPLDTLGPLD